MFNLRVYQRTTYAASITFALDPVPDIRLDTLTLYLYDVTGAESLNVAADVLSRGQDGVALIELTPAQLDLEPGSYTLELLWSRANGEVHLLTHETATILERLSP